MTTCSAKEVAEFRAYHRARSDTASLVIPLLERVPLERTSVVGLAEIGQLCSFFKNIGDVQAIHRVGSDRFSIAAAVHLLEDASFGHDSDVTDARKTVLHYLTKFGESESCPCVTLVHFSDGAVLLDGNKTCMAAFMHARHVRDYALPVYWLEEPTKSIRQALG
jgi:hypothetical protein